ncbi:MAG TPA: hypothetical protein PKC30_09435 [Saprospiraceae bacterium]|nr:hypothetical protein [Saprospiraceae bacterium]
MKNIITILSLLLFLPTLLPSQLANRPRNPIMVINCETIDLHQKRKLIQVRENGCPDGFIEIDGFCYLIIDCESEEEFPDGWTRMDVTDYLDYDEDICVLVPDCNISVGCEEFDCTFDVLWDFENLVCLCYEDETDPYTCCPEVLVDPEVIDEMGIGEFISMHQGCIEIVETDCYDGELDIRIPPLSCAGLQPGEEVFFSILIIGVTAQVGEALTIEQLENCDLIGGQALVLQMVQESGAAGWIFKDGEDEGLPGIAVVKIEFTRDPFAPSIINLVDHDPIFIPACSQQIPTTSTWGLIILGIGFMILGSLYYRRRWVSTSF